MSVNSRIPPPFANRLSGASVNSACAGMSFPSPSLCGPQSSRYTYRVDPRRACGVAPAFQFTTTTPPLLSLLCRRRSPSPPFSRSLSCSPSLSLSRALSLSLSLFLVRVSSLPLSLLSLPLASLLSSRSRPRFLTRASPTRARSLFLFLSLSFSSQRRVLPLHLPCHVSRGVPNATAPPLPQAVTPLCTSPPRRTSHLQPHAHVSSTALLRTKHARSRRSVLHSPPQRCHFRSPNSNPNLQLE